MGSVKKYPSKVLLFGEYAVISGGSALAIPYSEFNAYFEFGNSDIPKVDKIIDYWEQEGIPLDFERLKADLSKGMSLKSSIPIGSGLGSSGAVVAAIFDRYAIEKDYDIGKLKKLFAKMESYFHGKSSGFDPLVSYFNNSISSRNGKLSQLEDVKLPFRVYLWSSGRSRNTKSLVDFFVQKTADEKYRIMFEEEYTPLSNHVIETIISGNSVQKEELLALSSIQRKLFEEMIPDTLIPIWDEGLNSGEYCVKLCGAGGGGFFLIFEFSDGIIGRTIKDIYPVD